MTIPQTDLDFIFKRVEPYWEQLQGRSILLTGGTGVIGRWLAASFQDACNRLKLKSVMHITSRDPLKTLSMYPYETGLVSRTHFQFWYSDPSHPLLPPRADFVIHGSGAQRNLIHETKALVAELKPKRFLFLSSGAVYEKYPKGHPRRIYQRVKESNEEYLMESDLATRLTVARVFSTLGPLFPLNREFALSRFLSDALDPTQDHIWFYDDEIKHVRSYIYLADLTVSLWKILFQGSGCYDLGGLEDVTIDQLAEGVSEHFGKPLNRVKFNLTRVKANPDRTDRYTPEYEPSTWLRPETSFRTALAKTCEWFKLQPISNGLLRKPRRTQKRNPGKGREVLSPQA